MPSIIADGSGLIAEFEVDPGSWCIYAGKHLIADIRKEDWDNQDVDFFSKEAGQLLISHVAEWRAAFPMNQIVREIEDPTRAIESDTLPNKDQGTSKSVADEVLKLMSEVLDEAETFGPKKAHLEALVELEKVYKLAIKK